MAKKTYKAGVKVMNSYNYGHFEVTLSSDQEMTGKEINEMRKAAQRLVDEAIRQYQVAKVKAEKRTLLQYEKRRLEAEVKMIQEKPKSEWSSEDKAKVKALDDHEYWAQHDFDYDDDEEY